MYPFLPILKYYDLSFSRIRDGISLAGSPERTLERYLFEDENGFLFIAESVPEGKLHLKNKIARGIDWLHSEYHIRCTPYLKNQDGNFLTPGAGNFWQIIPYIEGVPLNRDSYLEDEWRADAFADFLIAMNVVDKKKMEALGFREVFSLKSYVGKIVSDSKKYHPGIHAKLWKVISFLEAGFFLKEKRLEISFAHGDFHPLNTIWGEKDIRSVIDWEFCGFKPEIYDLANLAGCIGMENPDFLAGSLMENLLKRIISSGIYSDSSIDIFLDYLIALRFAWLSEWLRKNDLQMMKLETTYLNLLVDNYHNIRRIWNI